MAEESAVDKLLKAIEDATAVKREVNEATKDLRAAIKDAKQAREELMTTVRSELEVVLSEHITGTMMQITEYQQTCYKIITDTLFGLATPLVETLATVEERYINCGIPIEQSKILPWPTPEEIRKRVDAKVQERLAEYAEQDPNL